MKKAKLRELLNERKHFEPTFWNPKAVDKVYEKALKFETVEHKPKKKAKKGDK